MILHWWDMCDNMNWIALYCNFWCPGIRNSKIAKISLFCQNWTVSADILGGSEVSIYRRDLSEYAKISECVEKSVLRIRGSVNIPLTKYMYRMNKHSEKMFWTLVYIKFTLTTPTTKNYYSNQCLYKLTWNKTQWHHATNLHIPYLLNYSHFLDIVSDIVF